MRFSSKIAIIGPFPPPYGGISVHIKRLLEHLPIGSYVLFNESKSKTENQISFNNKFMQFFLGFIFLFKKYKLVHHHTPSKKMRIILSLSAFFHRNVYLHIHGKSIEDSFSEKSLQSFLLKRLLKYVHIIADNKDIVKIVKPFKPISITEIDAFIPPKFDQAILEKFNDKVCLPPSEKIISMVGWFKYYNNEDLYGFDLALEALNILRTREQINISVVASVNGIHDEKLYQFFLKRRKELNLNKYFILLEENLPEIWPLYLYSNVFIRPTNADGSPLSIKEALWYECKTIASDCVPRPSSTVLFKNRDIQDLIDTIMKILNSQLLNVEDRIELIKKKKFEYKLIRDTYGLA